MSISTETKSSGGLVGELSSNLVENSLLNDKISPDVLGDILARLKEIEQRVLSMSKANDAAAGSVNADSQDCSGNHVEKKGEYDKVGMKENENVMKGNQSSTHKPSNALPETPVKVSSEVSHDPRYKYTEITASGSSKTERPRERPKLTTSPTESSDTIVEYEIRFIKDEKEEEKREFIIRSLRLKRLMWTVVRGWVQHCGTDEDWDNDQPLPLRPPVIFHHWDELQALAKPSDKVSKQENGTRLSLQHFLDDVAIIDSGDCQYEGNGVTEQEEFELSVWAYDWDGSSLLRRSYEFSIDKFEGEKRISELPIYPVEFFVDDTDTNPAPTTGWPALRRIMTERAELFRRFCACEKGSQLFQYSGPALVLNNASDFASMDRDRETRVMIRRALYGGYDHQRMGQQNVDEEVIVDPSSFITHGTDYAHLGERMRCSVESPLNCKHCATLARQNWIRSFPNVECGNSKTHDSEFFDDQYDHFMLLPSRVLGFLLGRKQWAQFRVENIHELIQDNMATGIESQLSLPKDIDFGNLQNMVKSHNRVVNATGPTGVGKTFTAEILAKVAGMPLYKAGISEIGTRPREAEKGLRHLFDLAQAWNAILLIDEADVFLDSRGSMGEADLEKNAMVAEYFSGILIMTTNRVMTFDVAMLSRIHWPINFGYLDTEQEDNIWKIWRAKWKSQNEEVMKQSDGVISQNEVNDELKHFDIWRDSFQMGNQDPSGLNAREIRNIFMGARTMANGGFVKWNFIRMCYTNTMRFRKEMRDRQLTAESALIAGVRRH
ncbi:hypothetical protein OPT61_g9115 [Boeremia exigua]|uniref:Uncharacterized protein n=1 Tax=Boeremia exigua TaxID=749465 RepID=A0ACC2HW32_9PLEO|nr:hypothetical protein OPT61_g9115 [Boeremia exigua]